MQARVSWGRIVVCLTLAGGLGALFGCGSIDHPVRIYPAPSPDVGADLEVAFRQVSEGDKVAVVLTDGRRFEGEYRGLEDGIPHFTDLKWELSEFIDIPGLGKDTIVFPPDEISEVYDYRLTTTAKVYSGVSLGLLLYAFVIIAQGESE